MKISIQIIGFVAAAFLGGCQEEEFVSQRDYAFIESVQIIEIDDSGATAVFEILKPSPSAIQEYGVEFLEADIAQSGEPGITFLKISQMGSTEESVIEQRINYDLLQDREYLVRPFVKAGNKISYGEALIFDSRGVNPPIITEISQNELYQAGQIRLVGDFFHSRKELNLIELPDIGDEYLIMIDSASRKELWFTYIISGNGQLEDNAKLDLKVTSGGKSTVIPDAFTIILPRIVEVSPLNAFVGDKIQIRINQLVDDLNGIAFRIFNETFSQDFYPETLGGGRFQFDLQGYPFGKYKLAVIRGNIVEVFGQEIEIKLSWEVFAENIPWTDKRDWRRAYVGDKLLVWNPNSIEFAEFYSMEVNNFSLKPLPVKPGNTVNRESPLIQAVAGRYLYFGLGDYFDQSTVRDFHRYDTQTNSWERLPDFPFELSGVAKSFVFQGKIYLEMVNGGTFITFDLSTLQWEITSLQIPDQLRNSIYLDASDQGVFYMPRNGKFELYRYIPGQIEDVYMSRDGFFQVVTYLTKVFGDQVLIFDGSRSILSGDLGTREFREIQTIDGTSNISAFPWITSKGLLMTFPYLLDQNRVENKVYRLAQEL